MTDTVGKYLASAGLHQPAWDWARARGIDPALMLAGTGLDAGEIEDPGCVLTTAQQFLLLHNLMALAEAPGVGRAVGWGARLEALGLLGLTMAAAPSVGEALDVGQSLAALGGSLGVIAVSHGPDESVITFSLPPLSPDMQCYLTEDFFSALLAYIGTLCEGPAPRGRPRLPGSIRPRSLALAYPVPDYLARYEALFRCPLVFGAPRSEMTLDAALLARPAFLANELAFEQGLEACRSLSRGLVEESVPVREARQVIARSPADCSTLPMLARQLDMPVRTLQRRLAASGLTFSELLGDVRHALARDLLMNRALTVQDVASLLGYSEAGNFRRAFRQWTGLTPSDYRRSMT